LDCLTGLYAGFAIFTVLGYMYESKCASDFADVVAGGPELAFIVYPEGLGLIKAVPPLWSILFFLMMLALGFGSEVLIIKKKLLVL
jgi:SNF family Na+-dependent transporter